MKTALVVPTNREDRVKEFISKWHPQNFWDIFIVVEDNATPSFILNDVEHHVSWAEIDDDLGEKSWIISRQDSAIRSYGFLLAARFGADYIFTLDDDCYPQESVSTPEFINQHISALCDTPKWAMLLPGMRTRGTPYRNVGRLHDVVLNVGLWENNPDWDSIQSLSFDSNDFKIPETCKVSRILPTAQFHPISGMNLVFKRCVLPLCYFPLMGKTSPFSRFDDIWFGVICKKICDHLGLYISTGPPFITHIRASDPFENLQREAPGIAFNEHFWELIDNLSISGSTPTQCMVEVGNALSQTGEMPHQEYLIQLGDAIKEWVYLINTVEMANVPHK